jgi:hypothetical protein
MHLTAKDILPSFVEVAVHDINGYTYNGCSLFEHEM